MRRILILLVLLTSCERQEKRVDEIIARFDRNQKSELFDESLNNKILDTIRLKLKHRKTIKVDYLGDGVINVYWNQDSSIVLMLTSHKHPNGLRRETVLNVSDTLLFVRWFDPLTEEEKEDDYELVETFDYLSKKGDKVTRVRHKFPTTLADTIEFRKIKLEKYESNVDFTFDSELDRWKGISGYKKSKEVKSLEQLKQEITIKLEEEDTIGAIQLVEDFNLENPDIIESQAALVVLKMTNRHIDKGQARKQLSQLYLRDTSNKWVQQFYSQIIVEESSDEEGLLEIEKMIKAEPHDFWNYLEKGRKLIELKRYNEAVIAFDKAIELEPLNRYAHADRALAKYLKGNKQGACNDWRTPGGGAIAYFDKYCK